MANSDYYTTSFNNIYGGKSNVTYAYNPGNDPRLPVVVLLHGLHGDQYHFIGPRFSPGCDYDLVYQQPNTIDRGWSPYPGVGPWSFEMDRPRPTLTGYASYLISAGYGVVWYSQCENDGFLANPSVELRAVYDSVVKDRGLGSRSMVLLGHSRGGILARKFLADNRNVTEIRNRIKALLTLHSPHQGSQLANMVRDFGLQVDALKKSLGSSIPALVDPLVKLRATIDCNAYREIAIGSKFLSDLAAVESSAGGPFVPTYTWGGTSSRLVRLRMWDFTWSSKIPVLLSAWPPRVGFHWQTDRVDLPAPFDQIQAFINIAPELQMGVGDILTQDARTHVPGERSHTTNRINHAEALWDEKLQSQVLNVLKTIGSVSGGPVTSPSKSSMAAEPATASS